MGLEELSELNYLKLFNHPNVLHCDHFAVDREKLSLILPFANGGDLFNYIQSGDYDKIDMWIYQLISAVHFLHLNGYYHCDIKPENVLIINGNAVLADLGMVGKIGRPTTYTCQTIKSPQAYSRYIGKPAKSSEQQDDVWALGMTIYLIVVGKGTRYAIERIGSNDAFIASDRSIFLANDQVPEHYIPLLLKLLDPEPHNRENLISTLADYPVMLYSNFVPGEVLKLDPVYVDPVIFLNVEETDYIKSYLTKIRKYCDLLYKDVYSPLIVTELTYDTIDLFFRMYPVIRRTTDPKLINYVLSTYCIAIHLIVLKLNNAISACQHIIEKTRDYYISPIEPGKIYSAEVHIVRHLNGVLTRDKLYNYLGIRFYAKGITWILTYPEKYQSMSFFDIKKEIVTPRL